MQSKINDDVNLPQAVTLRSHSIGGVKLIDILTDYNEVTKKIGKLNPADSTYKDIDTVEFTINLSTNQYVNLNSVHLCFPSKTKRVQQRLQVLIKI